MRKFYRTYFAVALMFGFHKHVYRVSNYWGGNPMTVSNDKYAAAAEATKMLIDDGYHSCPSCTWATPTEDEHVNAVGSHCHDAEFEHLRRRRREGAWLWPKEIARLARMARARRSHNFSYNQSGR